MSQGGAIGNSGGGGGGDVNSLTPNTGGAVTATGDTIPTEGYFAGTIPVVETYNDGNVFKIADQTYFTPYVVDPSTTPGTKGTFQTIQDAIDQAVLDGASQTNYKAIVIRYNENPYVENLNFPTSGIVLFSEDFIENPGFSLPKVVIQGTHTYTDFNLCAVRGISFNNTSASSDTFSGSAIDALYWQFDTVNFTLSGSGNHFNCQGGSNSNFVNCNFSQPAFQEVFTGDGTTFLFNQCHLNQGGFNTSNGFLQFDNCNGVGPVVNSNTELRAYYTQFNADTQDNISGTGQSPTLFNCNFTSNSTTTVASSMGLIGAGNGVSGTNPQRLTDLPVGNGSLAQAGSVHNLLLTSIGADINNFTEIIGVTDTSAPRTIRLPATSSDGHTFIIKDQSGNASVNAITVEVFGGVKTIDGATSVQITQDYGVVRVYYSITDDAYFTF